MSLPFTAAAAINTSNTTVGFADSDIYGMSPADIDRTLDEMQAMGVNNVRILIPWAFIEFSDDDFHWDTVDYLVNAAYQRNMGVLGVLTSTPAWAVEPGLPAISSPPASTDEYAEFVGAVAQRYAGKVSAYEVWNEPNAYFFWYPEPDPAAYTELLQAAYPAIKAADPNATVIGGVVGLVSDYGNLAISPARFVEGMYAAGAQGYFDALSYHPYHYTTPLSQGRLYGPYGALNQMDQMRQLMVDNGDGDLLIWASEYGEPTSVVDEATQAAFIQDFLNTWSQIDYAGPSFIYTTRDRDTQSTMADDTFGVLRDDWTWKPAAYVVQDWTTTYPQTPAPVTLTVTTATAPTTATPLAPMDATTVPDSTLTTGPAAGVSEPAGSAGSTGSTKSTDSTNKAGSTNKAASTSTTRVTDSPSPSGSKSGADSSASTSSTRSGSASSGASGSPGSTGSAD